ncbi:MAG: DNA polymerase III subunit delta [Thermoleophilia bacterium]|nr:DNA polymerase III subunit delta [Thermoleophilia bacterium]
MADQASRGQAKRAPLKPAYLVVGDDRPKVELALRRLRERIVQESGTELNIDEFRAGQHSAEEVVSAANTMAFLGGLRLVLVHGVDAWRKADKDRIAAYLLSPAPDACLALVGEKLPAGDVLRKAVPAVGDVLEYNAPKPAQLPDWVVGQAKRLGLQLGAADARLLVQRVGDEQHLLLRELEKLAAYVGRGRATREDVLEVAARSLEASVFDLVDAVAAGRAAQAFNTLEELYEEGEKPTALFYRILRHFQHLSRAVALREEGLSPEQTQAEIPLKPFPARKVVQQAGVYSVDAIREAMGVLAQTDARMKGMGNLPTELEFELCLGKLLALR